MILPHKSCKEIEKAGKFLIHAVSIVFVLETDTPPQHMLRFSFTPGPPPAH